MITLGRRLARASRHLRVRVTVAATLTALAFAFTGALVFVVLFDRALLRNTDTALLALTSQLGPELAGSHGAPKLAAATPTSRTTVVQLVDPQGRLRQTVTSSLSLAAVTPSGHTALATSEQLAAARLRTQVYTRGSARVVLVPVVRTDGTWVLIAAADLEQVDGAAQDAETAFVVVVPLVVVLIGVGAWLLSGAVLRPVEHMRADAARLRRQVAAGPRPGTPGQITVPDSGDQITALAVTMNQLLADLAAAADRQRALVADAGHELRTPLTVLRTELELADRPGRSREQLLDAIRHAATEVDRLTTLANDLLLLADAERRTTNAAAVVDLWSIAQDSARAHRAIADHRGIHIDVHCSGDPVVTGDRDSLRRVLDNLLSNAVGVGASRVVVRLVGHPDRVDICVSDDGPGFQPEFVEHAFDRFSRADSSRHRTGAGGAGLGLAIVAAVAHAHRGLATAVNRDHGAEITVSLPRLR